MSVRSIRVCDVCGVEASTEPTFMPPGWRRVLVSSEADGNRSADVCADCLPTATVAAVEKVGR